MDQRRSIPVRLKEEMCCAGMKSSLCMYNRLLNVRRDRIIYVKSRNGRTSSTISLSIKNKMRLGEGHCVGHVNVTFGTLLDACSRDECTYNRDHVESYI